MIILNAENIAGLLEPQETIGLVAQAMRLVSENEVVQPLRWAMPLAGSGLMGMMPGAVTRPACFGIKVVNMMPANAGTGFSSHSGCMLLFDAAHGQPLALLDAGVLTARRTAAASALATELLARDDAHVLAVIGAGEQARAHIEALLSVMELEEVRVCARDFGRVQAFCDALDLPAGIRLGCYSDPAEALEGAHVVCTVTSSPTPVVDGAMLAPGMHLNLVGACTRDRQEITTTSLPLCQYFLDATESAWDQAGELHSALEAGLIDRRYPRGEIGQVLNGDLPGRRRAAEITVYRSLGVAAQDLVVAEYLYRQALEQGLGTEVRF